jgi:hypothetical protein
MSRLIDLLSLLSFSVPLASLLLVSLWLVALKRRSNLRPWLSRLAAPPFYLVSLPIATLIVGAEMLGCYLLLLLSILSFRPLSVALRALPYLIIPMEAFPPTFSSDSYYLLAVFGSLIAFWAATFTSGFLLWRTAWRENHHHVSLRVASRLLPALFLFISFAWTLFYLTSYIRQSMVLKVLELGWKVLSG